MRLRGQSGQTTTEYMMISGLMTTIAVILLNYMYPIRKRVLEPIAKYIISGVSDPDF